jgi:hypothetical protein
METTLRIDKEYLEVLKELSKESGVKTQKEYVQAMILYFKETGIDPKAKNKSTTEELSKLRNTIISFIREQEKKKLDPLISKMNEMFGFLLDYYKNDAVTKKDIYDLIHSKETQEPISKLQTTDIDQQKIYEEKYSNFVKHVKSVFKDFEKNIKSSAFGGYSIDKAVFDKYKSIFEKL